MSTLDIIANVVNEYTPVAPDAAPASAPAPDATPAPAVEGIPDDVFSEIGLPAEEEVKVTPDSELEDLLKSETPPKENQAWAKTKHEIKVQKDARAAAEARVTELEAQLTGAKLPEETIKGYEDRIAEQDKLVAKLDLSKSEGFQREYVAPIRQEAMSAIRIIEQHGGRSPEDARAMVARLADMKFQDRNRYLMDEVPELAGVVNAVLINFDDKRRIHDEALASAEATGLALQESESKTQQIQGMRDLEAGILAAVEESAESGNFFLKKSKGKSPESQAWNDQVDLIVEAVKQTRIKNSDADINRLSVKGIVFDKLLSDYQRVKAENRELRKENGDVVAAKPSVRNNEPVIQEGELPDGLGVEGLVNHIFNMATQNA